VMPQLAFEVEAFLYLVARHRSQGIEAAVIH
jgi:hypothetical protein